MEFWDTLLTTIVWLLGATIFIAYLMALFSVLADIFRDSRLGGWGKAMWILFLIFIPVLTTLIYLIARGDGMAERAVQDVQQEQQATDDYIRSVTSVDPGTQIETGHRLLKEGAISAEEFQKLKARVLGE